MLNNLGHIKSVGTTISGIHRHAKYYNLTIQHTIHFDYSDNGEIL